jgi:hypothetical protein
VGVDRIKTLLSPLPFIPSHRGEGRFLGEHDKMLEENSQIRPCRNPMSQIRSLKRSRLGHLRLVFGIYLGFGIWSLGFDEQSNVMSLG